MATNCVAWGSASSFRDNLSKLAASILENDTLIPLGCHPLYKNTFFFKDWQYMFVSLLLVNGDSCFGC